MSTYFQRAEKSEREELLLLLLLLVKGRLGERAWPSLSEGREAAWHGKPIVIA